MDANELKKLMSQMVGYMARHGLQRMKIKNGDLELELEKPKQGSVYLEQAAPAVMSMPAMPAQVSSTTAASQSSPESNSTGHIVSAPIVGTFYSSSTPGAAPFVKVGDHVEENSVVCIIEAMKVMNEIRAGKKGKVAEIFVENGHPVEFGTKILRIV